MLSGESKSAGGKKALAAGRLKSAALMIDEADKVIWNSIHLPAAASGANGGLFWGRLCDQLLP